MDFVWQYVLRFQKITLRSGNLTCCLLGMEGAFADKKASAHKTLQYVSCTCIHFAIANTGVVGGLHNTLLPQKHAAPVLHFAMTKVGAHVLVVVPHAR